MTTKTNRSKPTPAAVQQALELMRLIAQPTRRERAEERMRKAKAQFSEAARLALAGDPEEAEDAARQAYAAVQVARAELAALNALRLEPEADE